MKKYEEILLRAENDLMEVKRALMVACGSQDQAVHLHIVEYLRKQKDRHEMEVFKLRGKVWKHSCLKK